MWMKTTNNYLDTYPRYDILGNVVALKDPRLNIASISYDDDFGLGSNPGAGVLGNAGPTYAFPTLVTSPPPTPGAQPHSSRTQYDYSTGLPTGTRDPNNTISQTIYDDPFNRPTMVKSALGIAGMETHAATFYAPATAYGLILSNNDVLRVVDQSSLDDAVLRSWTHTDGFGRPFESCRRHPPVAVKVATIYDALSRVEQVSKPYRPAQTGPEYTTSTFDLSGRVRTVKTSDNAVVSSDYNGNAVT